MKHKFQLLLFLMIMIQKLDFFSLTSDIRHVELVSKKCFYQIKINKIIKDMFVCEIQK